MTAICLCLIIKNEEKNLSRCLDSVKDLINELVLIDTGSTDKSLKIAESYKKQYKQIDFRIYQFQWSDNFAEVRNYALKKVKSDWILSMDADEILDSSSIPEIKQIISQQDALACLVNIKHYIDIKKAYSLHIQKFHKLFRNHPDISYKREIHEQISDSIEDILKNECQWQIINSEINIIHYGWHYENISPDKFQRNIRVINKALENKELSNHEKIFLQANLAHNYFGLNQLDDAGKIYQQIIENAFSLNDQKILRLNTMANVYMNLFTIFQREKSDDKSREILEKALYYFPELPTLHYMMANLLLEKKEYRDALEYFANCLRLNEDKAYSRYIPFNMNLLDIIPMCGIAFIHIKLGNNDIAIKYLRKVLKISPGFPQAIKLLKILKK